MFDAAGVELGSTGTVSGPNASQLFAGLVAIDMMTNMPVPVFSSVSIVNGSGWPGNDNNEGVALDDFVFGVPTTGVPEPTTPALLALGLAWLGFRRRHTAQPASVSYQSM